MQITIKFLVWARKPDIVVDTADLQGANLRDADLQGANLRDADLQGANLRDADLQGANLRDADLQGADLQGADLQGANLRDADLQGADLQGADLQGANLRDADLRDADLQGADLQGANLRDADLRDAKHAELAVACTVLVPEGSIVGWKKCCGGVIVKLRIPEAARRSNAAGRKCRAEFVEVLSLSDGDVAMSMHAARTEYRPGATVHCDSWCEDRWRECAGGIHFYLTREEAEAHT